MPGNLYLQHLTAGLHLAGANGATSFPDVKGHSFYRTGAVAISTVENRFASEGAAYFPGGSLDLIKCDAHADFGVAGSAMAIAFSVCPTALPVGQDVRLIMIGTNGSSGSFFVAFGPSGNLYFGIAAGGATSTVAPAGTLVLNTWHDVLFTMFGQQAVICVNRGVVANQPSQTVPVGGFPKRVQIGGDNSGFSTADGRFQGYLSDVEIQLLHGRMPAADAPTGPFLDTLGIGLARAGTPPLAAIRQAPPALKILRQGAPAIVLDTEHGGRGRVVGTTKNIGSPDYPVARRVRLLRKRDGVLAREAWSDAAGNYLFNKVRHDREYVVMAHDHTGLYNAVVADTVTPELIP